MNLIRQERFFPLMFLASLLSPLTWQINCLYWELRIQKSELVYCKPTHKLYLCINQSSTININPACCDLVCMQEREFLDLIGTKCPRPLLVWAIFFHILRTLTVFFHQMMSVQKQHIFPRCRVRVEAGLSMWDEVIIPCPTEIRDMVVSIRAA